MGSSASQATKQAAAPALRVAGEPMNKFGLQAVHEKVFLPPQGKSTRQTICRCWVSKEFPRCDNTHQRLQKLGCNVGPAMFEVKGPQSKAVGSSTGPGSAGYTQNLSGSQAFAIGGMTAAGMAGAAHLGGVWPF